MVDRGFPMQYLQPMGKGLTSPHLIRAEIDGAPHKLVVKPYHCDAAHHQPGTCSAVEMLCSVVADAVGLPTPSPALVEFDDDFIKSVPEEHRSCFAGSPGWNFSTRYLESSFQLDLRKSIPDRPSNLFDILEDLLGFDCFFINGDRKETNPNVLFDGTNCFVLDNGLSMAPTWLYEGTVDEIVQLEASEVAGTHIATRHISKQGRQFARALDAIKGVVSGPVLEQVFSLFPNEWKKFPATLARIREFILGRAKRVGKLVKELKGMLH